MREWDLVIKKDWLLETARVFSLVTGTVTLASSSDEYVGRKTGSREIIENECIVPWLRFQEQSS